MGATTSLHPRRTRGLLPGQPSSPVYTMGGRSPVAGQEVFGCAVLGKGADLGVTAPVELRSACPCSCCPRAAANPHIDLARARGT